MRSASKHGDSSAILRYQCNMVSEPRTPRLAVLIDADNTTARIASGLFEEIAKIGDASVRRIYGDFSGTRLKSWADVLSTHAIMPYQNFAYTTGKNASDIALVIDAMDLLHAGRLMDSALFRQTAILRASLRAFVSRVSTFMASANRRPRKAFVRHVIASCTPRICCQAQLVPTGPGNQVSGRDP
jgi:NYN domain